MKMNFLCSEIRLCAALTLIGLLATGGLAKLTGGKKMGWDEMAAALGCPHKANAHESADGSQYLMEYLPAGESFKKWDRMYTVTQMRVPSDEAGANRAISAVIQSYSNQLKKSGATVTSWNVSKGNYGQVLFGEYTLKGEWNALAAGRVSQGIVAIHQLAGHSGRPSVDQLKIINGMVGQ
jgi:hypothetical protein